MAYKIYAGTLFCSSIILVISVIQFMNEEGYGYNGILTLINSHPFLLDINGNECNEYISNIKSKRTISKVKTIINISFNSFLILYVLFRIRYPDKKCKFGAFISFLIIIVYFVSLIFTGLSMTKYKKTKYDSDDLKECNYYIDSYYIKENIFNKYKTLSQLVAKLDIVVITLICVSFFPMIVGSCYILVADCDGKNCCEEKLCWIFPGIKQCISVTCECFCDCLKNLFSCEGCKKCCKGLGKCCGKFCDNIENCCSICSNAMNECCNDEISNLNNTNNSLQKTLSQLEKKNQNLNYVLNDLKTKRNKLMYNKKQIEVVLFYLEKRKVVKNNEIWKYYPEKLLLSELEDNYGLTMNQQKFEEITFYYIKTKLTQILSDQRTSQLFIKPVINKEGKTFEGNNQNLSEDCINNNLVKKICDILRKGEFGKKELNEIKNSLFYLGKLLENPVVSEGVRNKGNTIEDPDKKNYKNNIIIDVISIIRDFFEDEYFNIGHLITNTEINEEENNQETLNLNNNNKANNNNNHFEVNMNIFNNTHEE